MKSATYFQKISYVSWVLGQSAAMFGGVLCLIWGFDLVLLIARQNLDAVQQGVSNSANAWHPPLGPPLIGLGITLVGWLVAHLQQLSPPTPLIVAAAINMLALLIAIVAATF